MAGHRLDIAKPTLMTQDDLSFVAPNGNNGRGHYDSRSDRAFTSSLRCRTISSRLADIRFAESDTHSGCRLIESNRALSLR